MAAATVVVAMVAVVTVGAMAEEAMAETEVAAMVAERAVAAMVEARGEHRSPHQHSTSRHEGHSQPHIRTPARCHR